MTIDNPQDALDENAVTRRLLAEARDTAPWSGEAGERHVAHRHDHDRVLVVTRGGIAVVLPEIHRSVDVAPGDRLELPAGTLHEVVVGRSGVECIQVRLTPGTLNDGPFHRPGWARLGP